MFSGCNWKVATTTYHFPIQATWNINSKCRQPITVTESTTATVNLSLSTYTNNLNQHVPCINLDSSRCTNIINYTPHVCANSSTTFLNHVPNMHLNCRKWICHWEICHCILINQFDMITYTSNTTPQFCTSNHVIKPHCYTTSICTNNFNNIPQSKSLKHEPILNFNRSTSDHLYNKP